jgi:hypothetical protein
LHLPPLYLCVCICRTRRPQIRWRKPSTSCSWEAWWVQCVVCTILHLCVVVYDTYCVHLSVVCVTINIKQLEGLLRTVVRF